MKLLATIAAVTVAMTLSMPVMAEADMMRYELHKMNHDKKVTHMHDWDHNDASWRSDNQQMDKTHHHHGEHVHMKIVGDH